MLRGTVEPLTQRDNVSDSSEEFSWWRTTPNIPEAASIGAPRSCTAGVARMIWQRRGNTMQYGRKLEG
jgi:hypothetical protein